jgi:UDP-GlcNAc:undecaprenyl-phosphate/decaprenyl-phosphate GlcNAc-1-phosphate transferase
MGKYGLTFSLAVGLSLALTPLSRRLALRIGAIDHPSERRVHVVATPRLGGPAILLALALAMLLAALLDGLVRAMLWWQARQIVALAIGALMVTLVGAIDDVRPLRPSIKLCVEIAAAAVVVHGGYRIDALSIFHLGALSFPLNMVFIVATVNAVNMIDGLDGLAVGQCLIISATLLLMCSSSRPAEAPLMLAALCGVLLGFLPYNFHPARIFLGDSGALLLGFAIAAASISTSQQMSGAGAKLTAFLVLGLPLGELSLTTLRRFLREVRAVKRAGEHAGYRWALLRRPALFTADCDHIHHRLLGLGFNHRRAVALLYAVCATSCGAVFMIARYPELRSAALVTIAVASIAGLRRLGYRELMPLRSGPLLPLFEARARSGTATQVIGDTIAITSSYALACLIEGEANGVSRELFLIALPIVAILQMTVFAMGGLYRRSRRHKGIDDAIEVSKALAFAVAVAAFAAMLVPSLGIGLRVVILDAYILATMVLGARLSFRVLEHLRQSQGADFAGRAGLKDAYEIVPRVTASDAAPENATPRRTATVVPIRNAGVPR